MAKGGVRVHVYGDYDAKDIKAAMRDLQRLQDQVDGPSQKSFGKLSGAAKAAGVAVAAAAAGMGVAIGKFAMDSIGAASDLSESQSKVTQVFGNQANQIMKWAESSSTAFGQSKQQALEAAGTYGNLLRAFGLSSQAAQEMSTSMVELAADLASFNNTSIDDAIQAIRSGLSGETEPLKRFGVALTDARLKSEALAAGIYEGAGALNAGQKAQAAYALILKDTTLAQGDFARTSDGLANTQRILQAAVDNAKASIGMGLVEALQDATQSAGGPQGLANAIEDLGKEIGYAVRGIALVTRYIDDLSQGFNEVSKRIGLASDETDGFAQQLSRLLSRGPQEGIRVIFDALVQLGKASEDAARTTEAWSDYRRAQQGVVDITPAIVDGLNDTADAAAGAAQSGAAAAQALLQYAISTGQVPAKAAWSQRFDVAEMLDNVGKAGRSAASGARSAGSGISELGERIKAARATAVEGIKSMREELRTQLEASRQEFNDYASNVSQSIRGAIDFSAAAPEFDEQGNRVGLTFIEALQAQATKAQEFATKVKTLIAMGLSQDALQQVLAAGVQAGTNIANELITGGATTIEQTNQLVATTQAAADEVGLQAATNFYGAGVDTAQRTYEGFKANFGAGGPARKALMGVMDNLAAAAARQVRIDVAVTRNINEVVTRVVQTINAPVEARAMGGPVKAGSPYLIGERGPELFVPDISGTVISNADLRSGGGSPLGGGVTINVNAGMGTNGAEVGRQIVEALKQYSRANGPVPIKVA